MESAANVRRYTMGSHLGPRPLDQPLPEDLAFRPGGDERIVPKRRKPPASRSNRIILGGSRSVTGFTLRDDHA